MEYYERAGATIDLLGPSVKYARRVAIKKSDLVVIKDKESRKRGYTCSEGEKKKATPDDVAAAHARLQNKLQHTEAMGRMDTAKTMVASTEAP